ncbi:hypothetical protein [Streptomyces aurantiogriseus]|uniref:Uncharacterized protein n=1 Tax=Streptomyces aurantiogriseus TaxID=66870 RepID=A0A918C6C5_9ACTN|nr:hypothetical protein [Streptomyces aurantiogriseus]GGR07008.1 hypothetical protein GCM10010251_23540 [Streptomyces aurantiogriseus]
MNEEQSERTAQDTLEPTTQPSAPDEAEPRTPEPTQDPKRPDDSEEPAKNTENDKKEEKEPPTTPAQVHHNNVNQYFYGALDASGSLFGIGTADSGNGARRRAVGRLDAGEADALLAPYVRPACFEEAARALDEDGVVVLVGPPGTGKRSGAVALVDAVATGSDHVVLSPGRSLDDLAGGRVAFEKGVGYVLLDRMNEETSATADFDWRRVRDTVREHGAYLVVTTVHPVGAQVESVRHVPWRLPDLAAVLRVRLRRAACAGDTVERAVALMPSGCTVTEVAAAAERIARGADPAEVWREYGSSAAQPVREWFAEERSPQEWVQVTTLAFVTGAGYREFETWQEQLAERVTPVFPEPPTPEQAALEAQRVVDIRLSLSRNALVAVQERKHGALTRTALVFPQPQYRQWVLEELWAKRSTPYWDGVRDWLTRLVAGRPGLGLQLSVAQGLALLALPAFDEVVESYLHPWAAGRAGPAGQSTATLVLQCMCLDESLAATALGVARGWARSSDPMLRSTATSAFSGALGVRFPTDAVHTLLRLILRRDGRPVEAAYALAGLVAVLAECDQDTGAVFRPLAYQMRAQRETRTGPHKETVLDTVLTVLRARDARTGRLVCTGLLERDARLSERIGALWAGVLENRPRRGLALRGLYAALRDLPVVTARPQPVAERFGRAVGAALAPDERLRLTAPLRQVAAHPDEATAELIEIFMTAVLSTED